jgi:transcriptional regulator with XRE-family HTH domain
MIDEVKWSLSDAERLHQLRVDAGLGLADLAKMSGLSDAQISQLECEEESLFYSPRIKFTVGKRLTLQLIEQAKLKTNATPRFQTPVAAPYQEAHKALLAIEEMSRRNLDASPVTDFYWRVRQECVRLFQSKYVVASLGMVMVMMSITLIENPQTVNLPVLDQPPLQDLNWTRPVFTQVFQATDWVQGQFSAMVTPPRQ